MTTSTPAPATNTGNIRKDTENTVKEDVKAGEAAGEHALSHLEQEFIVYAEKIGAAGKAGAKKLLAWVASKV